MVVFTTDILHLPLSIKDISVFYIRPKTLVLQIAYVHGYKLFCKETAWTKLFCNKIIFGCTFSSGYERFYSKSSKKSYIYHGSPLLDLHEFSKKHNFEKKMAPKLFCNSALQILKNEPFVFPMLYYDVSFHFWIIVSVHIWSNAEIALQIIIVIQLWVTFI